jgi:hypothetical protein
MLISKVLRNGLLFFKHTQSQSAHSNTVHAKQTYDFNNIFRSKVTLNYLDVNLKKLQNTKFIEDLKEKFDH